LLGCLGVRACLVRQDQQPLSLGSSVCQAYRLLQMIEEFLGCRRIIGPRPLRQSEIRIERNGLVQMLQRILGQQLF